MSALMQTEVWGRYSWNPFSWKLPLEWFCSCLCKLWPFDKTSWEREYDNPLVNTRDVSIMEKTLLCSLSWEQQSRQYLLSMCHFLVEDIKTDQGKTQCVFKLVAQIDAHISQCHVSLCWTIYVIVTQGILMQPDIQVMLH